MPAIEERAPAGAVRYGTDRPSDEARPRAGLRLRAGEHEVMRCDRGRCAR